MKSSPDSPRSAETPAPSTAIDPAAVEEPAGSDAPGAGFQLRRWIGPALALAVVAVVWTGVHHELRNFRYQDVAAAIRGLPAGRFWLATGLALAAYLVLAGYDEIALRSVGRRFPLWRVSLTSFIAYAMSQTLGFALVTGGSVRYRFWTSWGLSTTEIATAMSYVVATFTVGLVSVAGLALVLEPSGTAALLHLPIPSLRPLGIACLVAVGAYVAWSGWRHEPIRFRGWELPVPTFRLTLAQLGVATVDWCLAAAVLYVLLPPAPGLTFAVVLGAFLISQTVGIASHVPGGLGIVEGITVVMLAPYLDGAVVLASVVAFRAAYYLIPFALGLLLLVAAEGYRQRARLAVAAERTGWVANVVAGRWIPAALPYVLGGAVFAAGVVLLLSGATPSIHGRVRWLVAMLPLGVIELSHFLASLAGAALIIVGWALSRRLDAAYRLTQALLLVGIVASLLKGFDWEEALTLGVVFAAMLPARRVFYRRAALMSESFSPGWVVAVIGVIGFTVWLGLFSFKHVEYSNELWWRFTTTGDAPRYLRAMVGVVGGLAVFAFARLFRHAPADPAPPTPEELDRAQAIVREAPSGSAALALVGDKSLWFSEGGRGFLMFAVSGRSWVAMGDPVGPLDDQRELAWRFREEADRHGAWTVFYEVGSSSLPLYLDLGLTLLKLGEEAVVPLETFTLDGSGRKGLRRSQRDFERHGAAFAVVPPEEVPAMLDELEAVSNEWLAEKKVREKSFSLGCFDRGYLARCPAATVRIGGRIIAFANLWPSGHGEELSIDLMRYRTDAPGGVMQYLFTELMLWGKANGFRSFNLGMAPLSGFEPHALSPLWTKAGALLFRHGEHFYNFQGLRQYKEKFDPVWRPRYLASPGGLALPRILTNVASLIAGGLSGVVRR